MSRLATRTVVRRSLEARAGWRTITASIPGLIGAQFVGHGDGLVPVGIGLLLSAVALLALPLFAPERSRARLLAAAAAQLPDTDGAVTLAGRAVEAGEPLTAPYSHRPCLAYWGRARTADPENDERDAVIDAEQQAASCDFAIAVGETQVLVAGRAATLVFDRAREEVLPDRKAEIVLCAGDRVVVRGVLVRDATDGPYRTAARIVGAVTVVLDARRA